MEIADAKSKVAKKERLQHIIRNIVADVLEFELADKRLGLVTILDVQVSGDFKHAKIFWSVLGGEKAAKVNSEALNSARGRIRTALAKKINLKTAPEIEFIYDEVEKNVESIDSLIELAHKADSKIQKKAKKAHFANSDQPYKTNVSQIKESEISNEQT
ncbi:MAG: 30S ribosome-binding factor RbfA [Bifidobacteriaceae bacterium]|jgi:ribosome-binding factor A|nr:30S ribosome-binding factor RbfA [Bifidobacteriaceae bacterium]